jgi:hypothetical protein
MRFYTYYPYPHRTHDFLLRKLDQKEYPHKHQIVDCGIYDLLKTGEYEESKILTWKKLTFKDDSWKTVPDYPDLNKNVKNKFFQGDNIILSQEMARTLFDPNNSSHLLSIQGHYQVLNSFKRYCKWIKKEFGILDKLGIGTIGKLSTKEVCMKVMQMVRVEFPQAWIHVFGLRYDYIYEASRFVNSYDSTSWTFPRKSRGKNIQEKLVFFDDWMKYTPKDRVKTKSILDLVKK